MSQVKELEDETDQKYLVAVDSHFFPIILVWYKLYLKRRKS